jgi:hypothetical protein
MNVREFDAAFDEGRDVSEAVAWSKARHPDLTARSVNVDLIATPEPPARHESRCGSPSS